jgi:tryptophan-rich sensory protein
MKLNYIVIPLIVFLVALAGSLITSGGMDWYKTIRLPDWTPSGAVIGAAWTIIFILAAISVLVFWNKFPRGKKFNWIFLIFFINALLNILWSYLFFGQHLIGWAVWGAGLLGLSVILLIALIRPVSHLASVLLFPYAIWVIFATYLTYTVWNLNILK